MQPIHSFEYELTSELATRVHRTLVRWELRRSWRRDLPVFVGASCFAVLIVWLGLEGWMLPAVGGGLLCLVMLFVIGAIYRRWSMAYGVAMMALLALHTQDRRVRIEFTAEHVCLETEFVRGKGAWTELEEVVVFPGYWLLRLANGGQILIPDALVSADVEVFLRDKRNKSWHPSTRDERQRDRSSNADQ